ncbi:RIP metalloprotease RseP [Ligilactobacillus sp. WILCCON 0076]|uniref:Zinc metalloprotease n=1 Tax=Ligilactobacillus ubinensis TaxID=2876789 RepID=A0A9X2JK51_9LACO|nr:RIP metalloprotease RseP [Ligilactobacillus ubinensis]MCP0886032.1 RIP metalloprotease RseP [Ligilactobacillus ubinensis]
MVVTIIAFIIVFGTIVFVHEFGHYFFAKRAGILVREFSIGMGPKIFAYRKNETTYTIRILPLGGYVRMAGLEEDDEDLQKGMPASLILDDAGIVKKINVSKKVTLLSGVPIELVDWDLTDDLWISGYENGNEEELKKYVVDHDALIIEKDGTEVQIAPKDVQFQSASVLNRILTNFAGPLNNFLLAIVAFTLVAVMQGGVQTTTNYVASVENNSVAQKAGIRKNDQIIKINKTKTSSWTTLATAISNQAGKKTVLIIKRADKEKKITLTPETKKENGQKVGYIGISSRVNTNKSLLAIISYGVKQTGSVITQIFAVLGSMFTKGFSLNDLGGPVAMYSYTSEAAHYGVISVISLLALLSVNLGIVNLLPIPALDGGKLLLNIVEVIRGKPIDPNKEMIITLIGFAFMLVLMVLVTWNDISRYFLH